MGGLKHLPHNIVLNILFHNFTFSVTAKDIIVQIEDLTSHMIFQHLMFAIQNVVVNKTIINLFFVSSYVFCQRGHDNFACMIILFSLV